MAQPLDSSAMNPLMQMLVNIQRQNEAQRAQVGPTLGQGLAEMLRSFERQGDIRRSQEFADEQARQRQMAVAKQRYIDWQRERMGQREQRGFDERMLDKQLAAGKYAPKGDGAGALDDDIIRLKQMIAEGKLNGMDTSGLEEELQRKLGQRGGTAFMPTPQAAPLPGEERSMAESAAERVRAAPSAPVATPQTERIDREIAYLRTRPQDADNQRRLAAATALRAKAADAASKAGRDKSVNRVINTIRSEAQVLFADSDATPQNPENRVYKFIVDDIYDGITDPARLVTRAKERLADNAFRASILPPPRKSTPFEMSSAVSIGPDIPAAPRLPDDSDIETFVRLALVRLGKGR